MKKVLALILALAMIFSLAACGSDPAPAASESPAESAEVEAAPAETSSEPVEVVWWTYFGDTNIGYLQNIIDRFNESQTKYHASIEFQGTQAEMNAKIQSTSLSDLPALFSGAVENVAMYDKADYCANIQQFIDADAEGWPELEQTWESLRSAYSDADGKLVGYPVGYSYPGVFYNKTMFEAAGLDASELKSFNDLLDFSKQLVDGGYTQYGVGFHNDGFYFNGALGREGLKAYDNDNGYSGDITECLYVSDEHVNAAIANMLSCYQQLSEGGYMIAYGSDYQGDIIPAMADNECAMLVGVVSMTTKILSAVDGKFEVGIVPLPSATEDGLCTGEPSGGTGTFICNNGNAEQMQGGYELIKYMSTADEAAYFATCTGYLAPNQQSYDSAVYQDYLNNVFPAISAAYDSLAASDDSAANPYIPISNEMKAANKQAIATVCEGGDIQEAIEVAYESIQEAIDLYNMSNG